MIYTFDTFTKYMSIFMINMIIPLLFTVVLLKDSFVVFHLEEYIVQKEHLQVAGTIVLLMQIILCLTVIKIHT